jgi:hypothetical protein
LIACVIIFLPLLKLIAITHYVAQRSKYLCQVPLISIIAKGQENSKEISKIIDMQ